MPSYAPESIANEFLIRRADDAWPAQMQIQKLCYIAHGWNLAVNNEPLTTVPPEAWDNGPVYRQIWDTVRDYGYMGPHCTLVSPFTGEPFKAVLTDGERAVIDHVWRKYGDRSAQDLSARTHQPGTPWFEAYYKRGRNSSLDNNEIRDYYIALAMAGRENRQTGN